MPNRKPESAVASQWIPSPNWHSPARRRTQLIVVHSMETPLTQGYAVSIARNWFGKAGSNASSHYITGPDFTVQCVEERRAAWTVGANGNPITINIEQPGYARFKRAEWLTPTGRRMISNTGRLIADISRRQGGPAAPRQASRAQIRAYHAGQALPGGVMWCTHHQITLAIGGTTHRDPGSGYPLDVLQAAIQASGGVPVGPGGVYTVRAGDTLWGIADAHSVTVPQLVGLNNIKDPALIYPGTKLTLPGTAAKPKPKPKPPAKKYTKPPGTWPLPANHFFGLITGPNRSHGGFYVSERKYVKWIQVRLHELGYAPGGKWADGLFEPPTVKAVAAWQKARHSATTSRPGEVWSDDWRNLVKDR